MFGFGEEDPLDDKALVKAARRRLLAEIGGSKKDAASIINNVYGNGGGVMDHLGGGAMHGSSSIADDPMEYFVNVTRRDLEKDPATGKPVGWEKQVHRYRRPKDEKKK